MANTEWWHGAVLYEVYPRSFQDTDGDGVGDLRGVAARLDHIASLGVDAVWLAPFFASPQKDFGYDVSDHREVDPRLGTLADFDALVERAHALGLKVVIDQIWSHTSDAHPWFEDSRSCRSSARSDWYVWADPAEGGGPPNNWLSVFGGPAWTWDAGRGQFYLRRFLDCEPALNLHNPAVVEALVQTGHFWAYRGVDGLRFNAIDFLLHDPLLRDNPDAAHAPAPVSAKAFARQAHVNDMMQSGARNLLGRIRGLADAYPGVCTLGEVSSQPGALGRVARYTGDDAGLHMAYALRPLRGLDWHALSRMLSESAVSGERGWPCWSFGGHDEARVMTRMADGCHAKARLLMALLLSMRGSVSIYQGEELGLPQAELEPGELRDPVGLAGVPGIAGRDGARTPMPWRADAAQAGFTDGAPWLPMPAAHRALAADAQESDPDSMLRAYRAFLAWRRREPALRRGALRPLGLQEPLIGFLRSDGGEHVLAVFNLSGETVRASLADFAWVSPCPESGFAAEASGGGATIAPYGALFARVSLAQEWQEEAALSFA